jgi:UPF0755 protein
MARRSPPPPGWDLSRHSATDPEPPSRREDPLPDISQSDPPEQTSGRSEAQGPDLDDVEVDEAAAEDAYVYLPPESSLARRVLTVVGGIALFFVVILGLGGFWVMKQINPGAAGEEVVVTVPPGSTTAQIANLLERESVITNATVFQYYARWRDAGPFEAGVYDGLHKSSSMGDVIDRLEQGPLPPQYTELAIPEGYWVSDISAAILQTFPQMNDVELTTALSTVRSKFQPEGSTNLEGLLFPATYRVEEGDELDEQKLVRQMTEAFDAVADELGLSDTSQASEAAGRQLTPYEVVIVASMIEEEAKIPEERPMVARVVYNRLRQGMMLGIDATVLYAIGEQKEELTRSDLNVDSPYNTRRYSGLPPTPIASPGRASLEAALHPADGPWLYYVIEDADGRHFFTESSSEFERARQRAQQAGLL